MRLTRVAALLCVPALAVFAVSALPDQPAPALGAVRTAAVSVPQFDHVVIAMFENKNYTSINGSSSASYLNSLAAQGTLFTNSFGVTHPSQPNYVSLFSGGQQGITDDSCPKNLSAGNLGQQLLTAGKTFKGYSEGLPSAGYTGCSSGRYVRKHAPWADFPTVSGSAYNVPYSTFPTDFTKLPTVSFVIPDMCDDMHDCSISTGDNWLRNHLDTYAQWAKTHNSLLIATFDEDNFTSVNQIFTVFVGANVKTGYRSSTQINHYSVLRTLEDMYGLPYLGNAANKQPITDAWTTTGGAGTTVYSDGFETDTGWTRNASGQDTATAGLFERGTPQATNSSYSGQDKQLAAASGTHALVTGASAGSSVGADDVDGGSTSMTSPSITLPAGTLTLSLSYNAANGDNSGTDDLLSVRVLDGGQATTVFTQTGSAAEVPGQWRTATADLSSFAGHTVRLSVEATDAGTASLFEAEVDDVVITQG
ncbi:alkaline phosphatase family protein [Labedaea rhizosphaerae]|uniref:Phosphoesterase family protein n=1 Tax=Labedaea rhizosphaerae TaxID=598644 RepID=A0A4R6RUK8_LABRH|nr:alkaline phosphatase family protein [Labedaea rhizosphaerae]TDP90612.1 phosphoesterase family protein [Labedaea rhizosphaerae]